MLCSDMLRIDALGINMLGMILQKSSARLFVRMRAKLWRSCFAQHELEANEGYIFGTNNIPIKVLFASCTIL